MDYSKFSFQLTPSDPTAELGFETWINDQCLFNINHVKETVTVTGNLPPDDQEKEHILKFVLKNKIQDHTKVNELGEIVADATVTISELMFDNIKLNYLADKLTLYYHNFNATGPDTVDKFYGTMGCNGIAQLKFTTPIYLWFLENL